MVLLHFLCYSGHFTYRSVPKVPFLLDVLFSTFSFVSSSRSAICSAGLRDSTYLRLYVMVQYTRSSIYSN